MTKDLKFLLKTVKQASKLITRDVHIKAKDENGDLVTNFDLEIEKFISAKIKKSYPNFSIVSEEFNTDAKLTENCFTIDPIDGTVNFANDLPLWGIQVACVKDGKTCASVIYLKALKELYYADERGAYLNSKKIHVNNLSLKNCLYVVEVGDELSAIERIQKKHHIYRHKQFGATCVNFAWVACGRLGGTIFRKDSAWDYVPGMYLVQQAGGFVSDKEMAHAAANSPEFLKILVEEGSIHPSDDKKS